MDAMRIKLILAILAVCGALFAGWLIKYQYDKINALEAQKNELEQTLEKAREANVEAGKQIKKLRGLKANNVEVANWGDSRLPDTVLMLLQERYGYAE